jgi:hypothetical protein
MRVAVTVSTLALLSPFTWGFAPSNPRPAFVVTNHGRIGALSTSERWAVGTTVVRAARQESTVLDKAETAVNGEDKSQPLAAEAPNDAVTAVQADDELCVVQEDEQMSETQKLMKQVKDAGVAGVISYALWELGFWMLSVPVVIFGYNAAVGHFPDLSEKDDLAKLGAEAFAFVNFARFAVPLRIGLALSTTSWIQSNVVDKYLKKNEEHCEEPASADGLIANGADADSTETTATEAAPQRRIPRWRSFLPFGRRKAE